MKTKTKSQPLVCVITPVYNGEKYLADCIESVLAQTYENWVYIIVNNRSTDRTLEIAEKYKEKDSRILIHTNTEFLGLMQNWNHAISQLTPESRYCKVVHADDLLYPACIEQMVEVAEANPNVGIVGSYILMGNSTSTELRCTGIIYPKTVVGGHEVSRAAFMDKYTVFGPPTVTLIRADIVRKYKKFYNEEILYADIDACFRILQDSDFGFVHQVLSFVRLHEGSQSSDIGTRFDQAILEFLGMIKANSHALFTDTEYDQVMRMRLEEYYRFLAKNILKKRGDEFWQYHKTGLEKLGYPYSRMKIIKGALTEAVSMLLNLDKTFKRAGVFMKK